MMTLAVMGLLASGSLLEQLAHWNTFVKVDKFMILVPIMLNLKGNLEMNLSLRMSTAANIGEIDGRRTRRALVMGNLALLQVQALIVASVAGVLCFLLGQQNHAAAATASESDVKAASVAVQTQASRRGLVHSSKRPQGDMTARLRNGYFEFALVIATSMLSASLSSAVQGTFLCALVIWTRRIGGDPDNMAVPIAGSFGDLVTLTVLGLLASGLVRTEGTVLSTVVLALLVLMCVAFVMLTLRNAYVHELLADGWVPLFTATLISSAAGLLLDENAAQYDGFSLLAPVVSGLPGGAAAIYVSRISTSLHSGRSDGPTKPAQDTSDYVPLTEGGVPAEPDTRPATRSKFQRWASYVFDSCTPRAPVEGWVVPLVLLANAIAVGIVFLVFLWATGRMHFGWPFALCFTVLVVTSNAVALFLAHWFCQILWYWDYDPDVSCLPFVTSMVDVVGQLLQLGAFSVSHSLGDRVST